MADPDFIPANSAPDFIPASAPGKFAQLPGMPTLADAPGGPKSQPMSKVRTISGTPYNPGRIERGVVDQLGGAAQSALNVSGPVVVHRALQKAGVIGQRSRLYPDEGSLRDSARDATLLMAGGAEGLDAEATNGIPAEEGIRPSYPGKPADSEICEKPPSCTK